MSKYSFLDESIIAEGLVFNLSEALGTGDVVKAYEACRGLRNSASRIMRKLEKYEEYCEYAETVASWATVSNFLEFDSPVQRKENQQ